MTDIAPGKSLPYRRCYPLFQGVKHCHKTMGESTTGENDTAKLSMARHDKKKCTISCEHDGQNPPTKSAKHVAWVRCCLCIHWYHPECVELPQEETKGVWSCPSCRGIANDVSTLKETVKLLLDIVRRNNTCLSDLMTKQVEQFNVIKHVIKQKCDVSVQTNPPTQAKPSLLIGDSLIRNVKSKDKQLRIKSRVPKLQDIENELKMFDNLECIYIVNGTNDCNSSMEPAEVVEKFRSVITEAKKRSEKVVISSITPRTDKPEVLQKINTVNLLLIPLINEYNAQYVNNDDNFLYRNDTVDKSCLQLDECHLSHTGIVRLLKNLKLQDLAESTLTPNNIQSISDAAAESWTEVINRKKRAKTTKSNSNESNPCINENSSDDHVPPAAPPPPTVPSTKRKVLFQGHQHPLSNFYPCNLKIYDQHFNSAEAAYQYRKALEYDEWDAADEISHCERAIDAKKIGDGILSD